MSKEKIREDGKHFDSWEEVHFYWWCETLMDAGYIDHVEFHPPSFKLADPLWVDYHKPMKRVEDKMVSEEIMEGKVYTCDAMIIWNDKAFNVFFTPIDSTKRKKERNSLKYLLAHHSDIEGWYSYVEVKPIFDQNNMTRLAKVNIKWVYEKYKKYVNIIIPEKLFNKTFTPKRFLYCNKSSTKLRKLKVKNVRSLKDFIDNSSSES